MASIGGFDEACAEFLRVPMHAHIPSLSEQYVAGETDPIPLAAQVMGSDPELMAEMARALAEKGAPRIDLNCGCPSNTVTGKGAGSSLLKDPNLLHKIAKAMVDAVDVPVTAKLRSGFIDTSMFKENILAAQESGIAFLTLHPRTKEEGYGPPARWDLIAEAKSMLKIPVVGNGDITSVERAHQVLKETKCDALMIGRGALMNPWIFQEIKASFSKEAFEKPKEGLEIYLRTFAKGFTDEMPIRSQIGKLKQLMGFYFKGSDALLAKRPEMLKRDYASTQDFVEQTLHLRNSLR
jgi:tRNA-dihydrouridine synthase C